MTHTYVAYQECGCLAGCCIEDSRGLPKELAKWARLGFRIERELTEKVRTMEWRCDKHKPNSDRFYVDERTGCVAVIDRELAPNGVECLVEGDTSAVVWFANGKYVTGRKYGFWTVPNETLSEARKRCRELNQMARQ